MDNDNNNNNNNNNNNLTGLQLTLTAPAQVRAAVLRPDDPAFDMDQTLFRLTLKNVGPQPITLPFQEIRRNVVRVYTDLATGAVHTDNRTPPPTRKGIVDTLAPDESREIVVQFQYLAMLDSGRKGPFDILFCVRWRPEWLRSQYYQPASYQWNEAFDVCTNLRIVQD
jgi:hypothetical protein